MDEKSVGRVIRERRKRLSLTQDDLAELASIGRSTVSSLENGGGGRGVSLGNVLSVLDVLGLEIAVRSKP